MHSAGCKRKSAFVKKGDILLTSPPDFDIF